MKKDLTVRNSTSVGSSNSGDIIDTPAEVYSGQWNLGALLLSGPWAWKYNVRGWKWVFGLTFLWQIFWAIIPLGFVANQFSLGNGYGWRSAAICMTAMAIHQLTQMILAIPMARNGNLIAWGRSATFDQKDFRREQLIWKSSGVTVVLIIVISLCTTWSLAINYGAVLIH